MCPCTMQCAMNLKSVRRMMFMLQPLLMSNTISPLVLFLFLSVAEFFHLLLLRCCWRRWFERFEETCVFRHKCKMSDTSNDTISGDTNAHHKTCRYFWCWKSMFFLPFRILMTSGSGTHMPVVVSLSLSLISIRNEYAARILSLSSHCDATHWK